MQKLYFLQLIISHVLYSLAAQLKNNWVDYTCKKLNRSVMLRKDRIHPFLEELLKIYWASNLLLNHTSCDNSGPSAQSKQPNLDQLTVIVVYKTTSGCSNMCKLELWKPLYENELVFVLWAVLLRNLLCCRSFCEASFGCFYALWDLTWIQTDHCCGTFGSLFRERVCDT